MESTDLWVIGSAADSALMTQEPVSKLQPGERPTSAALCPLQPPSLEFGLNHEVMRIQRLLLQRAGAGGEIGERGGFHDLHDAVAQFFHHRADGAA